MRPYLKRKRRAARAAIVNQKKAVTLSQAGVAPASRVAALGTAKLNPLKTVSLLSLPKKVALLERSTRRSRIEPEKTLPPKYRSAGNRLRLRATSKVLRWEASPVLDEDWSARAREARVERFKKRLDLAVCKERPEDSRKGRGAGGAKPTFIPWCKK